MSSNLVRAILVINAAKKGWSEAARKKAAMTRKAKAKRDNNYQKAMVQHLTKMSNLKKKLGITEHPVTGKMSYPSEEARSQYEALSKGGPKGTVGRVKSNRALRDKAKNE